MDITVVDGLDGWFNENIRTRSLPESATYNVFVFFIRKIPVGKASWFGPSPEVPLPATVTPLGFHLAQGLISADDWDAIEQ